MPNKLVTFSPEQNQKVADFLQELNQGFNLYKQAVAKPFPDLPDLQKATEATMRQSLLDQRAYLMGIKSSLEIIEATLEHHLKIWYEGRKPLSVLRDWTRLAIRIFEHSIEENLLWEKPNPMGYSEANRRKSIFSENRRLGEDSNQKLINGAAGVYELTGVNILDWVSSD